MEDRVFKIAMLHLESTVTIEASSKEEIQKIHKLVEIAKGKSPDKDSPAIDSAEDFYEAARTLGLSKTDFPRVIMDVLQSSNSSSLPTGLIGDIGEFLGDIKGIGLIPTSLLQRTFIREELDKKMGQNKWEFFFKDEDKLKEFKKQKGF